MSDNEFPNRKLNKTEAERKRLMRENETPGERALRLEKQRERQSSRRQAQPDFETALRLEYQCKRQEVLRQIETEAESAERLGYKRKHQEAIRQSETENERMVRLESRTVLYETSKTLQSKRYLNLARSQISAEVCDGLVEQHSIGSMSYSCPICDAKFWESEKLSTSTKACAKFSQCCGEGKVVLPSLDIHCLAKSIGTTEISI